MAAQTKFGTYIGIGCLIGLLGLVGQVATLSAPAKSSPVRAGRGGVHFIAVRKPGAASRSTGGSVSESYLSVPDPSEMHSAPVSVRDAAEHVILAQLNAFRSGNFEQAAAYQSKSLRRSMQSTLQFRLMMSQTYPEFTDYKSAQFGDAKASSDHSVVIVPVTLVGADEVGVQALYIMTTENGVYRVMTVLGGMNPRDSGGLDTTAYSAQLT